MQPLLNSGTKSPKNTNSNYNPPTMHNLVTVNICGFPNILDTWELIHWITAKTLTGSKLTGITPQGTYTFNCKHLTDIELN